MCKLQRRDNLLAIDVHTRHQAMFHSKSINLLCLATIFSFAGTCQAAPGETNRPSTLPAPAIEGGDALLVGSSYVIGAGDILGINVWHEPEASVLSTVVRSDGLISLPLIKEIEAAGLTPKQLEKALTDRLSKQIRQPDVTVLVKEIHSERIYLIGALKKESQLTLKSSITVLQAIAEAGGLTDYAKKSKIYVLRKENGKPVKFPFDYTAVIRGDHMEQNIALRPGDTIVVPQ